MAEQTSSQPVQQSQPKKSKAWIWVVLASCGCLALLGCACAGGVALMVNDPEFKEEFERSYCESFIEQGNDPEDDPFGICK